MNWNGISERTADVTKNPPGACYHIALMTRVVGWSEAGLHLAFLLPAISVALGTYLIARKLCNRPLEAALAAILTPVFLISATTVMCDVLMLALWVWAVFLWMRGLEQKSHLMLAISAVLIGASALTKYFGISLIPLLFVYSIARERKLGIWAAYLLMPVAALVWYEHATYALYGRGLIGDAGGFANVSRSGTLLVARIVTPLSFAGGCVLTTLLYIPLLWRGRLRIA